MANSFINQESASEMQADLEAAVKVNPDMFRLDMVAGFGERLMAADCSLSEFLAKLGQVYRQEVRFTGEERDTIRRIVGGAGFKVTHEASKDSIPREEFGGKYNPVRDDYIISLDNGIGIHFLKMRAGQGGFLADALKGGFRLDYNVLGFFTAGVARQAFNTPELDILLYKRFDDGDFSFGSNMENLRKAFTLDFAKVVDGDAYWDVIEKFDEERREARERARRERKETTDNEIGG